MSTLIDKIRKARESDINVGGVRLTIRRPTDMDALEMSYESTRDAIIGASSFVVDWRGVTELDLVPGGTSDPVPFDSELFVEWIQDKPEHWESLINAVSGSYKSHRKKVEDAAKN